jgi:hypothetical protein
MLAKLTHAGRNIVATLALLASTECSGDDRPKTVPQVPASLVKVDVGDDVKIIAEEIDRGVRVSKVRVTKNRRGSPTADTFLLACALARVADARGSAYFANLKEWPEADGSRMYVLGFADSDAIDLQTYFGEQYSPENDYGQPRGFLATADWKDWWSE